MAPAISPCPIVAPLEDIGQLRALMPILENGGLYLDHAADGPLPQPSVDALVARAQSAATGGILHWNDWQKCVQRTRILAAELIGVTADDIAFVPSTAAGIATVAEGFPWQHGDNVVLPRTEFPSNRIPWMNLRRRGVNVRLIETSDDEDEFMSAIGDACDSKTRIVACSWVDYLTGVRRSAARLAEVAHRKGAMLVMDAIQGLGVLSVDMLAAQVDVLVAEGRKWLLGPEGTGILAIQPNVRDRIVPTRPGWASLKNPMDFTLEDPEFSPTARRYESGVYNTFGIAGLYGSMALLKNISAEQREQRILEVRAWFQDAGIRAGLQTPDLPRESRSGIISFHDPGEPALSVVKRLRNAGVVVNLRNDRIRVSPHLYNTEEDAARFAALMSSSKRSE